MGRLLALSRLNDCIGRWVSSLILWAIVVSAGTFQLTGTEARQGCRFPV